MVVPLGPGKFYGSSLPRPRIYTDVKLNDFRVDPPVPVLDSLMSWANEAHWSMGGLSFKRLRLQGRIEGNVTKLRRQQEKFQKTRDDRTAAAAAVDRIRDSDRESDEDKSPMPPLAPIATKRRRFLAAIEEEEDEGEEVDEDMKRVERAERGGGKRRRLARKLGDDFDRVAAEKGSPVKEVRGGSDAVAGRTRSRRSEKESGDVGNMVEGLNKGKFKGKKKLMRVGGREKDKANTVVESGFSTPGGGVRSSPRLAKR
ncbi:uncharacterized protein LOC130750960 [Actinidia eriantha]|uniref:uncharacterized protein LOC130750960 n=1 Tax=Actinidia eriantha TaxID=165200 RepID=UPI0025860E1B|nr:uncharacterized protein LOC130750960 [Actinidia eriantha]